MQPVTTVDKSKGSVPWDSSQLHNLLITVPLNNLWTTIGYVLIMTFWSNVTHSMHSLQQQPTKLTLVPHTKEMTMIGFFSPTTPQLWTLPCLIPSSLNYLLCVHKLPRPYYQTKPHKQILTTINAHSLFNKTLNNTGISSEVFVANTCPFSLSALHACTEEEDVVL